MHQVGRLLRKWRKTRQISQMQLALEAEVSARHISFVETGRSEPSREMILVLASQLEVPLRERNSMLMAAGYAPAYHETDFGAEGMQPARQALELILAHHDPFPAVVVDRAGDIKCTNDAAARLTTLACADSPAVLADGPPNLYRLLLHPAGVRHCIEDWEEVAAHLLYRAEREARDERSRDLGAVLEQVRQYPAVPTPAFEADMAPSLLLPITFRFDDRRVAFVSTIATLGTATDITLMEIRVESWFPASSESEAVWRQIVAETSKES